MPPISYQGFASGKPGFVRIAKLSIGMNTPETEENALEISDLYMIGR
jgi:hypothetical protein